MGTVPVNFESPCNKVCTLDLETGLCVGCLRTMDEIARWVDMTDAEREEVRRALASRKGRIANG